MIFPDKPRPPWQYAKPKLSKIKLVENISTKKSSEPKPQGYYRERIELALIIIGFYFWIQYWVQFV